MREKTKLGNLKLFLIFAGPAAVLFLCVVVIPFLYGLVLTFTNWNGISDGAGFVAFQNYVTAFKDTAFWHSLLLTLGYVAASVILINLVAFFLAYLLTSGIKGQNFLRSAFFTPNLIGGIVLGFIWQFVFNNALTSFGSGIGSDLLSSSWLSDPTMAFWALVVVTAWQYSGYMMIIYIAGLQNVPVDLVEAARIDGATSSQILFKIKIPMVMPSVTICTFLTLTNSFKLFDQNLSLTAGEPAKQSMMLAYNIYDTFYARSGPQWKGIGQAKAVVFFLFVVVFSLLQLHFTRSKEVQA